MDGFFHNLSGPAIEQPDGYKEWWVSGKQFQENEFNVLTSKVITEAKSCP
jgi:hypothetical protein